MNRQLWFALMPSGEMSGGAGGRVGFDAVCGPGAIMRPGFWRQTHGGMVRRR